MSSEFATFIREIDRLLASTDESLSDAQRKQMQTVLSNLVDNWNDTYNSDLVGTILTGSNGYFLTLTIRQRSFHPDNRTHDKYGICFNALLFPGTDVCVMGMAIGNMSQSENDLSGFSRVLANRVDGELTAHKLSWHPLTSISTNAGHQLVAELNRRTGTNLYANFEGGAKRGDVTKAQVRRLGRIFLGDAYNVSEDGNNPLPSDEDLIDHINDVYKALAHSGFSRSEAVEEFLRTGSSGSSSVPAVGIPEVHGQLITHAFINEKPPTTLIGLERAWTQAVRALAIGKHVILYGPPGSGKTTLAHELCRRAGVARGYQNDSYGYITVTASSDWSSFDLVGGYTLSGEETRFTPGIFLKAIQSQNWLLVDEINRANIDRALGPVFSILAESVNFSDTRIANTVHVLMESANDNADPPEMAFDQGDRMRYAEEMRVEAPNSNIYALPFLKPDGNPITIGYGDCDYRLPPDWRIVATMNSVDKASLFRLSYAFMRRFAFIEVPSPQSSVYQKLLQDRVPSSSTVQIGSSPLSRVLADLTEIIRKETSIDIGPAALIDTAKYVAVAVTASENVSSSTVDALEMFVFPQFEGALEHHNSLCRCISRVLGVEEIAIDRRISLWTGGTVT